MARSYKVMIGSTWLTDDASESGRPCKLRIEGIPGLLVANIGTVAVGNDTVPFREKVIVSEDLPGGGRPFVIIVQTMLQEVYEDLKEYLDDKADADEDFNVTGEGASGDFNVNAIVNDTPYYIDSDGFSGDRIKNVRISLITTTFNLP